MSDEPPYDRDRMAKWYAKQGLRVDPGALAIYDLPTGAPDREIRQIGVTIYSHEFPGPLEPIDYVVAIEGPNRHKLLMLNVTSARWERIELGECPLPDGWTLEGAKVYRPKAVRQ